MTITERSNNFDPWLALAAAGLLGIGFVMLSSASVPVALRFGRSAFSISIQQAAFIALGLSVAWVLSFVPIKQVQKFSPHLLLLTLALLVLVLVPGIGRGLNGSWRWIFLGPISLQPSELLKLSIVLYTSGYLVRRQDKLHDLQGFLIPMFVLALCATLLMLEPDFGAVIVIAATILLMLFLAGVPLRHFMVLLPFVLCVAGFLAFSSSYRVARLTSFQNPWANQFGSGYQLVQSLIAFGRGSILGSGLGSSVQKLNYLPEAHSDFIAAIIAEELGLVGILLVLALYAILAYRAMNLGLRAKALGLEFHEYLAYGLGLLISLQALINIAVNVGLLPTKGLTLPFISAGGSSMLVCCAALGLLFRLDYELSIKQL